VRVAMVFPVKAPSRRHGRGLGRTTPRKSCLRGRGKGAARRRQGLRSRCSTPPPNKTRAHTRRANVAVAVPRHCRRGKALRPVVDENRRVRGATHSGQVDPPALRKLRLHSISKTAFRFRGRRGARELTQNARQTGHPGPDGKRASAGRGTSDRGVRSRAPDRRVWVANDRRTGQSGDRGYRRGHRSRNRARCRKGARCFAPRPTCAQKTSAGRVSYAAHA